MKAFRYDRARTAAGASRALAGGDALLKAAGLDVLDRLKEGNDAPARVVSLHDVPGLDGVAREGDVLRIGALTTLATLAASPLVAVAAPALAEAAGLAASPALRNRATLGGNLGQHTRCGYYRVRTFPCFRRGDAVCPVRVEGGVRDLAGVFDNSPCACAHPSSLAPALGAAGATVRVVSAAGERSVPFAALYGPVAQGKASDLALDPTDVIVGVDVPALRPGVDLEAAYELRQKAAFDWAMVTCAVRVARKDGRIEAAAVWLGAVAPAPWRSTAAAAALVGRPPGDAAAAAAADAAVTGATPLPGTEAKLAWVKVAVRRALLAAFGRA